MLPHIHFYKFFIKRTCCHTRTNFPL
jgi:hypothetical protein